MTDHQSLGVEARALLDVLVEKLETTASRETSAPAAPSAGSAAEHPPGVRCTGCPLCAAVTYLKDHQELSAQLAQGALLIVGAVRQYLEKPSTSPDPSQATVQRIDIT